MLNNSLVKFKVRSVPHVRFDPAPASNCRYLPSTPEKIVSFGFPRPARSVRLNFFLSAEEQPLHQTHRAPDQRAHPASHGYRTQNDPSNLHGGCAFAASVFLCDLGHTLTLLLRALTIGRRPQGAGSTEHMQLVANKHRKRDRMQTVFRILKAPATTLDQRRPRQKIGVPRPTFRLHESVVSLMYGPHQAFAFVVLL